MTLASLRRRFFRLLLFSGLVLLVLVNLLLYGEARSMTTYTAQGEKTPQLELMSTPDKIGAILNGVKMPRPINRFNPGDKGLQYETVSISSVNGATLEGWFVPHDNPRALIALFHGYGGAKESMLSLARAFYDMGYDTLAIDFQGSGGSSGNDTTLGVREGADVAATLRYAANLRPGEQVILYGVSMGAAAVLRAVAAENVTPTAVVLDSPFNSMLSAVRHRLDEVGGNVFPVAEALVFWGSVQHGYNGFANNPSEYAKSVHMPALVLHGEFDSRVNAADANEVNNNLAGWHRLVEFPGADHSNFVDSNTEQWTTEITQFLAQVVPPI